MKHRNLKKLILPCVLSAAILFPASINADEFSIDYRTYYDAENIEVFNKNDKIYIKNKDSDRLQFVATPCGEDVYTTESLNLRNVPNVNSPVICTIPENVKLHRVGKTKVGWSIIQIEGVNYFMWDEYLTNIEPESFTELTSLEAHIHQNQKTVISEQAASDYLGTYKLTAYCNCSTCCGKWAGGATASGTYPTAGRTVASDLPFGTQLLINGNVYTVEDRGVRGNHIDIYFNSHSEALNFGVQYADVYLVQ